MPTQIIAFGVCSHSRCVTIFRTTTVHLCPSCAGTGPSPAIELILWEQNRLCSCIDERPSDFARIGSLSEGWLNDRVLEGWLNDRVLEGWLNDRVLEGWLNDRVLEGWLNDRVLEAG